MVLPLIFAGLSAVAPYVSDALGGLFQQNDDDYDYDEDYEYDNSYDDEGDEKPWWEFW